MPSDLEGLFARSEATVPAIYRALLEAIGGFGPIEVQPKSTSIHLVAGSAFAGVHPMKNRLRLNIRTDHPLGGERIVRTEQISARRFHNEVDLRSTADVDRELLDWLRAAYALGATGRTPA